MPLARGSSRGIIGRNVAEMIAAGHPQDQAVAAALSNARRHPKAAGGIVGAELPHYEDGGTVGFIHSPIPGRTDLIHASPPVGSYVVPADIVSGIGEGNSLAGAAILGRALATAPFGTAMPKGRAGKGIAIPNPPPPYQAKRGGRMERHVGKPTPILAAGGEYVIPPDVVRAWGGGDLKRGHDALDAWVIAKRKAIAKEQMKLPGPKQ